MSLKKFYIVFLSSAILFVSLTAYVSKNKSLTNIFGKTEIVNVSTVSNKDVIKFNHQFHAFKGCRTCLQGLPQRCLESNKVSDNLNPKMADCSGCHDIKDRQVLQLCHYDGVYKRICSVKKETYCSHTKNMLVRKLNALNAIQVSKK